MADAACTQPGLENRTELMSFPLASDLDTTIPVPGGACVSQAMATTTAPPMAAGNEETELTPEVVPTFVFAVGTPLGIHAYSACSFGSLPDPLKKIPSKPLA